MKALLSKPARMVKVRVGGFKENRDELYRFLESIGVLDLKEVKESRELVEKLEKIRKLHDSVMKILGRSGVKSIDANLTAYEYSALSLDKIEEDVRRIEEEVFSIEYKMKKLESILSHLSELNKLAWLLPEDLETSWLSFRGKHLTSMTVIGKTPLVSEFLNKYSGVKSIYKTVMDEDEVAILVFPSIDYDEYFKELSMIGVRHVPLEVLDIVKDSKAIGELRRSLPSIIDQKTAEISSLKEELRKIIEKYVEILGKYLLYLDSMMSSYRVIVATSELKHFIFVEGWVPEKYLDKVLREIKESSLIAFLEVERPRKGMDNPPSLMENPRPLKPFEIITKLYGIPSYWEFDPTPLVAYSFAFFFALMNSDVGYGLAGIFAILLILDKLVDDPLSENYRKFKQVLLISNGLSIITGALAGAFFGDLLHAFFKIEVPVLMAFFTSPIELIKLSMIIGLIHVNIAHAFAVYKFISEGRKGDLLNEIGLLISELFGIPYILLIFFNYEVPILGSLGGSTLLYLTLIGIAVLVAGNYLIMKGMGLFMWIFQITGILGDVLSYVRLAGVGLATYYMSMMFNTMVSLLGGWFSTMIPPIGFYLGLLVTIPTLIIVHLMVLILSILGAFIHSLRLCILEFLSKFYAGDGRDYSPLRIIASRRIVIK
ncbi:MAG: V-type ATP synthase subunit I [Thermosphaera aggregans]|jgi:V/A-type H+-transporting ATPase subunit I|uniref:V-type ATP synthase subunit I n=1 Tax=Thermosphaera aggregans TaxID=54254 RepID=UPI003C027E2E